MEVSAVEAGREADKAFGVLGEEAFIDVGLVIEAFEVSGGDEVDEVAVAFLVDVAALAEL